MNEPRLTVHVLDTATGRPAVGLRVALFRHGQTQALTECATNADGRVDGTLLEAAAMREGAYALTFDVAAWRGTAADPGFYDIITIRFVLRAPLGHVHVPLLLSPYGYSTYRGS